jgi:hypothetical protein
MTSPYRTEGLPPIQAGAAQRVITPPTGCGLAGYFHERIARRVRDDLHCRAVILAGEGGKLALISCDLIGFAPDFASAVRHRVAEATGMPPDAVLLCATHTHTGPTMGLIDARQPVNRDWLECLPERIAETARQAAEHLFPATLFPGRREETMLGSNRLGRQPDGSEVFGKTGVLGPAGPIDPEVLALGIRDEEGELRAVIGNYAMHPDVIGGGKADFLSADWPGEVARSISQIYGESVVTVFLNGACGDINHARWEDTRLPRGGPAKAMQMGRVLAADLLAAFETAEPLASATVGAKVATLDIPYFTRDAEFLAEIERIRSKPDTERIGWERILLNANELWDKDGKTASVPVQALRFGDLAFVGLPGEVFTKWGLEIKHWSPARHTFVAELANGWFGYVPTTDQAQRGAYGARPILSRQLIADGGRRIADTVQILLSSLWAESTA